MDADRAAAALDAVGFEADDGLREQLDQAAGLRREEVADPGQVRASLASLELPDEQVEAMAAAAQGTGLRANGPYELLGAWRNGQATITVERNTAPDPWTGRLTTYPAVAVVDGPNGRVAVNPDDAGLLAAEAARAAGDPSLYERREVEFALRSIGFEADSGDVFVRGATRLTLGGLTLGTMLLLAPTMASRLLLGLLVLRPGMSLVNTYKKKVIDAVYGNTAVSPPATIYHGLSTTTPAQDGTSITEPSGNGYARVGMTNNATNYGGATTANPSVKDNDQPITWAAASGAGWGTVTHWTTHDALTVGNPIDWAALSTSQSITAGTTVSFAAGQWVSQVQGV